jgi:DNA-binding MarR family transcriptional regulator
MFCYTDYLPTRTQTQPRIVETVTTPRHVESDLGWALGRVARAHLRAAQDVVAGLPGGPRGYQVLAAAAREEASTQLALAHKLGVDRTVMTYLLDELQHAGLVERRPDPADRRARRIVLTESGRARLCDLESRLLGAEERMLIALSPDEQDSLRTLLRKVATTEDDGASACQVAAELQACTEADPARAEGAGGGRGEG